MGIQWATGQNKEWWRTPCSAVRSWRTGWQGRGWLWWEDGIYDRLSSGGYQKAADNGPALKSCRIWQLGPSAPAAMRFIGLDRMSGEYGGPDLTRYQAVFDGTVSTNSLDGIWEAFCRRSLGSDGQPLAISDLVELYDDSGSEFYYVDRTAIVPVQLKAPEQESGMTMTL